MNSHDLQRLYHVFLLWFIPPMQLPTGAHPATRTGRTRDYNSFCLFGQCPLAQV